MLLSPIQHNDDLTNLPFYHLLEMDHSEKITYLIKDSEHVLGFIHLEELDEHTYKLAKIVINKPDHHEQLIEIFYHLLEAVDKKQAQHLLIETEKTALIELLSWLGFKHWPEEKNTLGYTYS